MTTKFLTLTVGPTEESLRDAWSRAGSGKPLHEMRPLDDELAELRRRMTFKQRVHVDRVAEWIAEMLAQGRVVMDAQPSVPPIA